MNALFGVHAMRLSRRSLFSTLLAGVSLFALGAPRARAVEAAGTITTAIGKVHATLDDDKRALEPGDDVAMGDLLTTGAESALRVEFRDKSDLVLGANSETLIDAFVYDGPTDDNCTIELTKGAFRWASGLIDEQNVVIETPTVTIGVRGTTVKVDIADDGSTELSTLDGKVTLASRMTGEILEVLEGQSILTDAAGIFIGGVRDFVHTSADEAVERGIDELRERLGIPEWVPIPVPDLFP